MAGTKKGKLKIYLGMSAGVGKTYSMLRDALDLKNKGVNVVCGYIEPHGRIETENLASKLPTIPFLQVPHNGITLNEFNLDEALKTNPDLLLLDELAHSNASICRHQKRWQDAKELIDAGINVCSTINIQHLEGIKDLVSQITGITINETVPDSFVKMADEIVVVDIPPEELIQRIKEGKVYKKEQAHHALKNFFRKGNLLALRELVLRYSAAHVDSQMLEYREQNYVKDTWPTKERILVCVAPNALSSNVVRAASRLAKNTKAELIALSVESLRYSGLGEEVRVHASNALRLAESMGAEIIVRTSENTIDTVLEIARERNVSSIVCGKPAISKHIFNEQTFLNRLVSQSTGINILVIPAQENESSNQVSNNQVSNSEKTYLKHFSQLLTGKQTLGINIFSRDTLLSLVIPSLVTAFGYLLYPYIDHTEIIMFYLLGVTWISTKYSKFSSTVATACSILLFDFFFVPPRFSITISHWQYLITFSVMLCVALIINNLTFRLRNQKEIVADRERRSSFLYELTKKLSLAKDAPEVANYLSQQLNSFLKYQFVILLGESAENLKESREENIFRSSEPEEQSVIRWVYQKRQLAGKGSDTFNGAKRLYIPLIASDKTLGVLCISISLLNLTRSERDLIETSMQLAASAIEKINLQKNSRENELRAEQESLRNTLLTTISHDLRTPLTSITGAVSVLLENKTINETVKDELLNSVLEETERLNQILRNVLDMTKVEYGQFKLNLDWYSIEELIGSALQRTKKLLNNRSISLDIEDKFLLIDGILIEQVLINLLENIAKHTPENSKIEIFTTLSSDTMTIFVCDSGNGFSEELEEDFVEVIFEKFYRGSKSSHHGFGLGLAICRAIIKAHGGTITARNRFDQSQELIGAQFEIILPIKNNEPDVPQY